MSDLVKQINDGLETTVATVVDSDYALLDYKYDTAKNNFRNNKKRYAVIPLAGTSVNTITKVYSMIQQFEIIITNEYVNRDDDTAQRDVMFDLYDQADEIFKEVYRRPNGLSAIVLNIQNININDPEFFDDSSVAVLRFQLGVTYRNAVN